MFELFVAYLVVRDLAVAAAASPIVVAIVRAECESEALIIVVNPVVVTVVTFVNEHVCKMCLSAIGQPLRRKAIASPGDHRCCKSSKFCTEWLQFTLEPRLKSSSMASIHT
ncbi:hypothetical protein DEO72_LG8g947 [Vigna unguiculata]|uniref:Secreted protein n=1 Tax=Vigna unguiculata TaxID=3917 RepID=A0A4D6MQJ4_VIGUN|nr:hypothetical protein DEO72_LG8g947 [Vigna unguiculata]